jgi:CBS domain-containing protein
MTPALLTLPSTTSLRACFEELLARGYSGCALVGLDGSIVANVSVADLRGLAGVAHDPRAVDEVLDAPAINFLREGLGGPHPPVTVSPADTLASLIELLCVSHVHRVHVVDAWRRPMGVVTTMDVLRRLLGPDATLLGLPGSATSAAVAAGAGPSPYPPTLSACPFVATALRDITALRFMASHGVAVGDAVVVSAKLRVTDAMKVMEAHGVSSVLVADREETVSMVRTGLVVDPVAMKKHLGAWCERCAWRACVHARCAQ